MWQQARRNKITYTELHFCSFPKEFSGMKLFFISDIHHRVISDTILNEIKDKVDIIIIGGDLAEKGVPFSRIQQNIKALVKVAPTYFVWGNNDYEVDHLKLEGLLKQEAVTILANKSKCIKSGKKPIFLIGVDDFGHYYDDIEKAKQGCEGGFQILVSHYPDIIKKIQESDHLNLILSGHTHGGQIRFFGFGITEKAGLRKIKEELYLLVSNGYGTTSLHLRLGAPAEAHVITLSNKE